MKSKTLKTELAQYTDFKKRLKEQAQVLNLKPLTDAERAETQKEIDLYLSKQNQNPYKKLSTRKLRKHFDNLIDTLDDIERKTEEDKNYNGSLAIEITFGLIDVTVQELKERNIWDDERDKLLDKIKALYNR